MPEFEVRFATEEDVPLILALIRELAEYEKLPHEVVATEDRLRTSLFAERPAAEVLIGEMEGRPAAFALFFHNFSTFLGKPGIYLEDLFVRPEFRGRGLGKAMLVYLAGLAKERDCGRLEWWVLDWNQQAIRFYEKLGARAMDDWTVYRVSGDALERLCAGGPETVQGNKKEPGR
jgi:GNAT superfamily N-acetyltransferase